MVYGCFGPLGVIRQTRLVGCNGGQSSRPDFIRLLQQSALRVIPTFSLNPEPNTVFSLIGATIINTMNTNQT